MARAAHRPTRTMPLRQNFDTATWAGLGTSPVASQANRSGLPLPRGQRWRPRCVIAWNMRTFDRRARNEARRPASDRIKPADGRHSAKPAVNDSRNRCTSQGHGARTSTRSWTGPDRSAGAERVGRLRPLHHLRTRPQTLCEIGKWNFRSTSASGPRPSRITPNQPLPPLLPPQNASVNLSYCNSCLSLLLQINASLLLSLLRCRGRSSLQFGMPFLIKLN